MDKDTQRSRKWSDPSHGNPWNKTVFLIFDSNVTIRTWTQCRTLGQIYSLPQNWAPGEFKRTSNSFCHNRGHFNVFSVATLSPHTSRQGGCFQIIALMASRFLSCECWNFLQGKKKHISRVVSIGSHNIKQLLNTIGSYRAVFGSSTGTLLCLEIPKNLSTVLDSNQQYWTVINRIKQLLNSIRQLS